jgi:hypothetical protein
MSGLFNMNSVNVTTQKARNTKARIKKNNVSGELGIINPHAGLSLGK